MQILPYNRVVKDLAGHTPATLLAALREVGPVRRGSATPERPGEVSVLVGGAWHTLQLPPPDPGRTSLMQVPEDDDWTSLVDDLDK